MAFAGYYYTALRLSSSIKATLWLAPAVILVFALIDRWLRSIHFRHIAQDALALWTSDEEKGDKDESGIPVNKDEGSTDVTAVLNQLRRFFIGVAGLVILVGCWQIWADEIPAFGYLDRFHFWSFESETVERKKDPEGVERVVRTPSVEYVTPTDIILVVIVIVLTIAASRNLPGLVDVGILQRTPIEPSVRYGITTITSYLIILVGIVIAAQIVGLGWSKLQWLAAGVGVGLGFGLQEIFANFISGLIILFERPIRVGDIVTVNEISGVVSRIRIRATTITDWDRKELVVPNKAFITGNLVNWTLSDKTSRVTVSVGVAYGSDIEKVKQVLRRIAEENPEVMEDPPPLPVFTGFGDSTLNFNLFLFLPRRDNFLRTLDELNSAIDTEFRRAGIEIAFPQRDLHLRTVRAPFPVELLARSEQPIEDQLLERDEGQPQDR
jgi:potassium efflux system protein